MPQPMSDAEVEAALKTAEKIDSFEFRHPNDEDNFIVAALFNDEKTGLVFRLVETSGVNSQFHGGSNIGQRLSEAEVKQWTLFKTE